MITESTKEHLIYQIVLADKELNAACSDYHRTRLDHMHAQERFQSATCKKFELEIELRELTNKENGITRDRAEYFYTINQK